jgi:glycosyltransferase involved in cell wall biosynthesis
MVLRNNTHYRTLLRRKLNFHRTPDTRLKPGSNETTTRLSRTGALRDDSCREWPSRYPAPVPAPFALSVAIVTLNEEANLPRCLESVRGLAAEIVVVDSGSTDRTADIARDFGAKFLIQSWQGHVAQKNIALAACSQPWVLSLDADEAVSEELATALRKLFASGEPAADGYEINRRTFYLGNWVRHSWNPEWRLRLARRDVARWHGNDPHDRLEISSGKTARLTGELLHYSYANLQDHFQRTVRYARISADALHSTGKPCRWYHLVLSPWAAFLKKMISKSAWRDGWRGWIISVVTAFGVFAKYALLLEKKLTAGKAVRS